MRKRTLAMLVGLPGIAVLMFLGKGVFDGRDQAPVDQDPFTGLDRPEPSGQDLTLESLKGCWVIYLHYQDETAAVEIVIDGKGNVRKRAGSASYEGMTVSFCDDGTLVMKNEKISLPGTMNPGSDRIEGMAVLRDFPQPVPFSCLKVGACPDER